MPTIEERVAYLEGRVSEHGQALIEIRDSIRHLEERIDGRFEAVDRRIHSLDGKMSSQLMWLVGIQVTTLAR